MKEESELDIEFNGVLEKVKYLILGEMYEGSIVYIEDDFIIFFAFILDDVKLFLTKNYNNKCYKILVDAKKVKIYDIDEDNILKVIELCNDNLYEVWNSFECVTN
jgi:hypothetical protein